MSISFGMLFCVSNFNLEEETDNREGSKSEEAD